jgi:phosphohistidine phosphatase
MQLYVIRHGVAQDPEPDLGDDARALTPAGKAKLRRVVRGLRALDLRFARVLTSPWKRAAQTARLLAPLTQGEPIATELLTRKPGADLLALIADRNEPTAVVGHEPWLGELVAWLAFGDSKYGEAVLLKKAGVVWLDGTVVPGGMQLCAVIPPRLLRAIA